MAPNSYHGFQVITLDNPVISLDLLSSGPHIVGLRYHGGPDLFPDRFEQNESGYGNYYSFGGHRLWHSPEAIPRTYLPNVGETQVKEIPHGVQISRPPEPLTGIAKQMEVRLDPQKAVVTIQHELTNHGLWPIECAVWALTMFRLGGRAILPLANARVDPNGLLPNRQLTFWPYMHLNDPRLILQDDFVILRAESLLPAIKMGYFNPHGWLAYWLDGVLFVKRFDSTPGVTFPDGGCNAETYCNDQFIELESIGPLEKLEPGKSLLHTETWELYAGLDVLFIPGKLKEQLAQG
jgi:hypothetical protein